MARKGNAFFLLWSGLGVLIGIILFFVGKNGGSVEGGMLIALGLFMITKEIADMVFAGH